MMKRKGFEKKLGIAPCKPAEIKGVQLEEIVEKEASTPTKDLNDDYIFIRNKLLFALDRSEEVINEAVKSIKTDPTARNIESISTVLKTINENSNQLLSLHQSRNKILKELDDKNKSDNNDGVTGKLSDIINS